MFRRTLMSCSPSGHGLLKCTVGEKQLLVGTEIFPMLPSNHLFHDPPKLRALLDREGYLYFKNIVPKKEVLVAFDDLGDQLQDNNWVRKEDRIAAQKQHGFSEGCPYPVPSLPKTFRGGEGQPLPNPTKGFRVTKAVHDVTSGVNVMALMRQVMSGPVTALPQTTFEFSEPGEKHSFHTDHRFHSKGSPLTLTAWMPLQNITLQMGGLVVVRGSNSNAQFKKIRHTYGMEDVESGTIHGDGGYTRDPMELIDRFRIPLDELFGSDSDSFHQRNQLRGGTISQQRVGKLMEGNKDSEQEEDDVDVMMANSSPLVTTGFEMGDVVLTTGYTMHSFVTNRSNQWRISAESKWIMEGDPIGADPRFATPSSPGLATWNLKKNDTSVYPRSMEQAKKAWGLGPQGDDTKDKEVGDK